MAERRMFTKKIIDSDAFTELPPTTQALYFHLCINADDDGFNNKIRQAMFNAHADRNDFNLLVSNRFIIPFDNKGVVVIKHWRLHNLIRKDRYHETEYLEEKATLILKDNGVYTDNDNQRTTNVQPLDDQRQPEVSIGKVSIDKDSIDKDSIGEESKEKDITPAPKEKKHIYGEYKHVRLTDNDVEKLKADYGEYMTEQLITFLDEYIEMKGYKAKNHYLAIKKWVVDAVKEKANKYNSKPNTKAQELNDFYSVASGWAESEGE